MIFRGCCGCCTRPSTGWLLLLRISVVFVALVVTNIDCINVPIGVSNKYGDIVHNANSDDLEEVGLSFFLFVVDGITMNQA
jgi:hypothetical protein